MAASLHKAHLDSSVLGALSEMLHRSTNTAIAAPKDARYVLIGNLAMALHLELQKRVTDWVMPVRHL